MITSIRNANLEKTKTVQVPATNITKNIGKERDCRSQTIGSVFTTHKD
uniref:Uncharacterized protein n=1 Tax=Physcomitrium patens TaxID=3218 RepID=A0A2K1IGZ9_PHYPA|nr:hypothetical protein PHYPA_029144 [Physcomitrium patens]